MSPHPLATSALMKAAPTGRGLTKARAHIRMRGRKDPISVNAQPYFVATNERLDKRKLFLLKGGSARHGPGIPVDGSFSRSAARAASISTRA